MLSMIEDSVKLVKLLLMAAVQAVDGLIEQINSKDNQDELKESDIASKVPVYRLKHPGSTIELPAIGFGLYKVVDTEKVTIAALQVKYNYYTIHSINRLLIL